MRTTSLILTGLLAATSPLGCQRQAAEPGKKAPVMAGPIPAALLARLPLADGEPPIRGPVIAVTRESLSLEGKELIPLLNGRIHADHKADGSDGLFVVVLHHRLKDLLKAGGGLPPHCYLLAADETLPAQTVRAVIHTATQAGYGCYQIGVAKPPESSPTLAGIPMRTAPHKAAQRTAPRPVVTRPAPPPRPLSQKPKVFMSRASVTGGLDASTIRRVIRRHLVEIRYCYVSVGLPENPKLQGMIKVTFTVKPDGTVGQTQVSASTLNHGPTEKCVKAAVRRWRFPKPEGSMPFITYPFHFKPEG